jgi:rod shape-determining protein MreC
MDFIKNKLLTIVLVLCLAFTVFIGITAGRDGNTGTIQQIVNSAISPVQKYVYAAGQRIGNVFYYISSIASTRQENSDLKTKVDELNGKLVDYDRYARENEQLNSLLKFKEEHANLTTVGGNVIGRVGENWFQVIILDIGENDGVKEGQYVVDGSALVGKIYETTATTSKVITVMDQSANIPAMIGSTGDTGVVSGMGNSGKEAQCRMKYVPLTSVAKVGDAVVTSNIVSDESYTVPSDILIGYIESIEDDEAKLMKVVYLNPVADLSRLDKVLVITE